MLYIILLSSFCPPKIDVALKITIEFLIGRIKGGQGDDVYHYSLKNEQKCDERA